MRGRGLKPKTLAFQAEERNIFFHILTSCNLSCRHCYINRAQHGTNTLTRETIANWLKLFYDPAKLSNLIFLGGEPTLHPDLPFAVQTARELGYQSITIDTNGFLHHDLLNRLTPQDAVLSFSLDGPAPEVNDPLRGRGVFDVCTKNIHRAVDKNFETSLIYTVSAKNISHLHKMPELVKGLGVKHFFIQIIGLRGNSAISQANEMQITPEAWLKTVPPIAKQAAELGLHVIYPKVFLEPGEPFVCAGEYAENFFIFPNGRVYACPLCEDFPIHAYNIEGNTLRENSGLTEKKFFTLHIAEGCVMNKLLQPDNLRYKKDGSPNHRISCCLLKQEMGGAKKLLDNTY
ncbi:MAG: radical SAM protein [Deltaproteobacteria bacterium]|nr:radical SAM protein [Deltaproteobacteria bacterium]